MIAVDSNIIILYLQGEDGMDMQFFAKSMEINEAFIPPAVLSEVLSYPYLEEKHISAILDYPVMKITDGYWQRAGLLRAGLIKKGYKPKLPDTLIAQSCLDYNVPLLTRDVGFTMFAEKADLKLYK